MTKGYRRLQDVRRNKKQYKELQWVTRGYIGVIRNSMAVKGVTRVKKDHRGIRRVT